jgi:hypothetical protein
MVDPWPDIAAVDLVIALTLKIALGVNTSVNLSSVVAWPGLRILVQMSSLTSTMELGPSWLSLSSENVYGTVSSLLCS